MGYELRPARAVSPGRILSRELDARGWTQKDLAEIMGRPVQTINQIVAGTKQITPQTAVELAQAFGTSAELWLNLETNYRLHLAREEHDDDEIARRGRLYSIAPVSELIKRWWIRDADSIDELEKEVCDFLMISSPDEEPQLVASFRHSTYKGPEQIALTSWVRRVQHLARVQDVGTFDQSRMNGLVDKLLSLSATEGGISQVPTTLLEWGVHFVVVPHLDKTYLDGAALLWGDNPTVALTLRYNRIDTFWFTLLHELAHITARHDEICLDSRLEERHADTDVKEEEANEVARDWLISPAKFRAFARQERFTRVAIVDFAREQGRHPAIVVGRLQYEGKLEYSHHRSFLAKVRPHLENWIDVAHPHR